MLTTLFSDSFKLHAFLGCLVLRMSVDEISNANGSFNSRAAFDVGGAEDEYRPDIQDYAWHTEIEPGLFTR